MITVSDLHERFYERQNQQQLESARLSSQSQSQLSQALSNEASQQYQKCIFLTQMQYKEKERKKREPPPIHLLAPQIKQKARKSEIFKGFKFHVFNGTYDLKAESILEYEEAETEGWIKEALLVCCQQDIIDFILSHGGECSFTRSNETDFIIGGQSYDAKVQVSRSSVEAAKKISCEEKKLTKTQKTVVEMKGVLKWTFLFRTTHKIINCSQQSNEILEAIKSNSESNDSIKTNFLYLINPRRYDFLVLSKHEENLYLKEEDDFGIHLYRDTNMNELKRALEEVDVTKFEFENGTKCNSKRLKVENEQWQYQGAISLEDDEKVSES